MSLVPVLLAAAAALTMATPEEPGTHIHLLGVVRDRAGHPIAGARVHLYQTDASGRYTPDKPMDEPHARLSGVLTTGTDGSFDVLTIRPGGYPKALSLGGAERHIPAHIHIDVSAEGHPERRAQLVFEDDPNLQDPYWKDWVKSMNQPVTSIETKGDERIARVVLVLD